VFLLVPLRSRKWSSAGGREGNVMALSDGGVEGEAYCPVAIEIGVQSVVPDDARWVVADSTTLEGTWPRSSPLPTTRCCVCREDQRWALTQWGGLCAPGTWLFFWSTVPGEAACFRRRCQGVCRARGRRHRVRTLLVDAAVKEVVVVACVGGCPGVVVCACGGFVFLKLIASVALVADLQRTRHDALSTLRI